MKILLIFISLTRAACPDGWKKRPDTSYCYQVFEPVEVSWNRAQSECNKYGADLVSYESENEMIWVYNNLLNWNTGSSSWRYYWNGLNDLHTAGQLEWVSSTTDDPIPYNYNNFGIDADLHDKSRRCTFSLFSNNLPQDWGHEGKWYKEKCEKTKGSRNGCE